MMKMTVATVRIWKKKQLKTGAITANAEGNEISEIRSILYDLALEMKKT
jgi:hypothetical protein